MKHISVQKHKGPGKQTSLVTSLLTIIGAIFCISAMGVFIFTTFSTKALVESSKKTMMDQTVQYYTSAVSSWLEVRVQQLQLLQHSLQKLSPDALTQETIMPLVENSTQYGVNYGVVSDYVVLTTKQMICGDGWTPEPGYDPTQNDYYQKPQSQELYISEPYLDANTQDFVITISLPIRINGTFYGTVARDVKMSEIQSMLDDYDTSDGSYLYLVDPVGSILSHANAKFETNADQIITVSDVNMSVMQDALNGYPISKDYDGQMKYYHAQQESVSGWTIGLVYPQKNVNKDVQQQILGSLLLFSVAVLIGLTVTVIVMKKKFAPIAQVTTAAKNLEEGNFDIQLQVNSRDELGILAHSFQDTGSYLREIIREISDVLQEISNGNLNVQTTKEYRGEFVAVEQAINQIIRQMNDVIINIEHAGEQVSAEAAQVADNAQHLSENSTHQSMQVENIVQDMQRIKDMVQENTSHTIHAETVTEDVAHKLEESRKRMSDMMVEMEKINQSSSEIEKIIKTIEDIAFQTNILALNAAVEAARAGTAGKGFAVVADEVRGLANKSAIAAQDSSKLIVTSIETINHGSEAAHQTQAALLEAVDSAKKVMQETQQIVELSQVQNEDIDRIAHTVSEFSNSIQTNTATAEENAATSEEMAGQAQMLKNLLSRFHTKQ